MRKTILVTTLAAATLVLGSMNAQADDVTYVRASVGSTDIIYESGIPYYRVTKEPVYVTYEKNTPTYYRVVSKTTYTGKTVPPPWAPAYGWRKKETGKLYYGHYDADGVWHWHD